MRVRGSVNIKWIEGDEFKIPARGKNARVIGVVPNQIVTESLTATVKSQNGVVESDVKNDILKLFVVERHRATGNIPHPKRVVPTA